LVLFSRVIRGHHSSMSYIGLLLAILKSNPHLQVF